MDRVSVLETAIREIAYEWPEGCPRQIDPDDTESVGALIESLNKVKFIALRALYAS